MKSKNVWLLIAGLLVVSLSACSSGSDQKKTDSPAEESVPATEVAEEEAATESTVEESNSSATSDTIATDKIGYGHYKDSIYLELVAKEMNGSQKDTYSESQLFNYARNTCTDLRAGNWQKLIDLLSGVKGTNDYTFFAQMTLLAIYAYCPESEQPFLGEGQKLGL